MHSELSVFLEEQEAVIRDRAQHISMRQQAEYINAAKRKRDDGIRIKARLPKPLHTVCWLSDQSGFTLQISIPGYASIHVREVTGALGDISLLFQVEDGGAYFNDLPLALAGAKIVYERNRAA